MKTSIEMTSANQILFLKFHCLFPVNCPTGLIGTLNQIDQFENEDIRWNDGRNFQFLRPSLFPSNYPTVLHSLNYSLHLVCALWICSGVESIGGSKVGVLEMTPSPISCISMQFSAKIMQKIGFYPPPLGLAPPG